MLNDKMPVRSLDKHRLFEMLGLSAALGLVFLIVNYIHFQHFPVSVILYACLLDALIASAIVLPLYAVWHRKAGQLVGSEIGLVVIASNLLIALYAVMGPTVIDRSLSIYIAEKIDHRGGEVSEAAMPKIILTEFMEEYKVSEVRMTEQVTSGTVRISDGCIHLTSRGKRLARFTRFYRKTFLPQHRLIGDTVTSDLTHPYENTPVLVPYECPNTGEKTSS